MSNPAIDEGKARLVQITVNSEYHTGLEPVKSENDAIALTMQRARNQPNWQSNRNSVIYDYNKRNVEEMLYDRLICGKYHVLSANDYMVQLEDVSYYVVDRSNWSARKVCGQAGMKVDSSNMNAYHFVLP